MSHRSAIGPSEIANAQHVRVPLRYVNDMVILKRGSGDLVPKAQGNHADGKLAPYNGWLRDRLAVKGDLTLNEIIAGMASLHGVSVHRGLVGKGGTGLG